MNSVFANLPVSVFEVMSRLAREQDAVNLGQGFPDDPVPQDVLQKAADAVDQRLEPVSADDGPARAAQGGGRALQALAGPRLRSRQRDHGHLGRDRGDRRRADGADRAGRRGRAVPAALRRLSAAGAAGRRRAALRAARAAALALRRGEACARLHAEDARGAVQQSAQSVGHRLSARRSGTARALLREVRRDRGVRRGVGARHVRRAPAHSADRACPACASAA